MVQVICAAMGKLDTSLKGQRRVATDQQGGMRSMSVSLPNQTLHFLHPNMGRGRKENRLLDCSVAVLIDVVFEKLLTKKCVYISSAYITKVLFNFRHCGLIFFVFVLF